MKGLGCLPVWLCICLYSWTVAAAVQPQAASSHLIANVTNINLSRDSCGSVRLGKRMLWVCRDTQPYDPKTGHAGLPVITNTASWTDFNSDGSLKLQTVGVGSGSTGSNKVLQMYGPDPIKNHPFYPGLADECSVFGSDCKDGSHYAIWPDSPPMVANTASDGTVTAYTWVRQDLKKDGESVVDNPPFSLYKVVAKASTSQTLPTVTAVNEYFWTHDQWGYGHYGNVVHEGYAYLWARNHNGTGISVARVPVGSIEDKSRYQYWVGNAWTSKIPGLYDSAAFLPNAGTTKQGTYYYSEHFKSFVWIGGGGYGVTGEFYISTAPNPQGPWIKPYIIYSGPNGNGGVGSYSWQAHPGLLENPADNAIYLTWTQAWNDKTYGAYISPLVYVQFK